MPSRRVLNLGKRSLGLKSDWRGNVGDLEIGSVSPSGRRKGEGQDAALSQVSASGLSHKLHGTRERVLGLGFLRASCSRC